MTIKNGKIKGIPKVYAYLCALYRSITDEFNKFSKTYLRAENARIGETPDTRRAVAASGAYPFVKGWQALVCSLCECPEYPECSYRIYLAYDYFPRGVVYGLEYPVLSPEHILVELALIYD